MSARADTGSARRWPGCREPTVWRAQGLLLASFLAAISGDRGAALPLLEEGTGLARQQNDPITSAFAAFVAGNVCLFAGDLRQAIAHLEDELAALPAAAAHARPRTILLIGSDDHRRRGR